MTYAWWLAGLSAAFVLLERLRPRRPQAVLRKAIWTDLFYLVFNGHFLGVLLAAAAAPVVARLDAALGTLGVAGAFHRQAAADLPAWGQFVLALVGG